MAITRICEACHQRITTRGFLVLDVALWVTSGSEVQDATAHSYGDFCRPCVDSGKAVRSLLALIDTTMIARARKKKLAEVTR